ncbi:MAG: hypothetical protein NC905_04670, partial [Candidatus Omnitrophica bacterium]|nr:hypothetical protein [Candidatus Omnitrophota bacterium]
MKRGILILFLLSVFYFFSLNTFAGVKPVFHLDFENGLTPEIGPSQEMKWSGKKTPQYSDEGLTGKALLIGESQGQVLIPPPENTAESGTLIFWSRGLENWNIWSFGATPCHTTYLANVGSGMIYKWCWYSSLCFFGHPEPTIWFPMMDPDIAGCYGASFDQYQWTQIGVSWQKREDEKFRVRIYLNGKMVAETARKYVFNGANIGGNMNEGGRRVIDNIKIWDRVLTDAEVKQLYRQEMKLLNQPLFSIPKVSRTPSIDGRIDPDEWKEATAITGLVEFKSGEVAEDQSIFYLLYDETYLYIAMVGQMTETARTNPALVFEKFLKSEGTGRTEKVLEDDVVEVIISPDYWQTSQHTEPGDWKEYRLVINSSGGYWSSSYGKEGADTSWNPVVQSASTVKSTGWQFECRIPLSSFEVSPKEGEKWGIQLGRIWKHLKDQHDVWAWGYRFTPDGETIKKRVKPNQTPPVPYQPDTVRKMHIHKVKGEDASSIGTMCFTGEPVPAVKVVKTGKLSDKEVDFKAEFFNPSDSEQSIRVKIFTDTLGLSVEEAIKIPGKGSAEFTKKYRIEDFTSSNLTFEVYKSDNNLIHRTSIPFYIEQSFGVSVIQYPNYEKFLVELDLGLLSGAPLEELGVDIHITDNKGKPVYTKDGFNVSSYLMRIEDTTAGFPPGDYTMSVIVKRGGKIISKDESVFKKVEKAVWWDNRYGYQDMDNDVVPYPWTDMKVEKDTVYVLNREYRFSDRFLPEQIKTF